MHPEQAEHTLETIRTLMERSQRYEHISGASGVVAGLTTLAGCAVTANDWLTAGVVWVLVFLVAFTAHICFTFARARQRGEPVWSRQARTVLVAVLPAWVGGVAATAALEQSEWPAAWLVFYGCGALATGFFAPRSIARLGGTCLTLGVIAWVFLPAWPILTMAAGFGVTHLVFGISVWVAERREAVANRFWRDIGNLANTIQET